MEWLAGIARSRSSAVTEALEETEGDGADEKEIESILKDPDVEDEGVKEDEDEEENLLTSPKTHFCPIQQEGEPEVQVNSRLNLDFQSPKILAIPIHTTSIVRQFKEITTFVDRWLGNIDLTRIDFDLLSLFSALFLFAALNWSDIELIEN